MRRCAGGTADRITKDLGTLREHGGGARVVSADEPPGVSVVIPTFNRLPRLKLVLDAICAQSVDRRSYEVLVVSDGSTDGTDDYLSTRADVVHVRQDNAGPGAARNRGVAMARGRVVLFIDDDVVATPGLVARHLTCHGSSDDKVVIGPMLNAPHFKYSRWVAWEQDKLYKQYRAMREGEYAATFRQFYTGNASVSKQLFERSGGFDESLRRAEDVELAYRLDELGATFVFDEDAGAHHLADRSFESWLGAAEAYGRNDVRFARDHHQDWLLPKMAAEFRERNALTQWLVSACLRAPGLESAGTRALTLIGKSRFGVAKLSSFALSALYAVTYYRSAAMESGDVPAFRRQLLRTEGSPRT